MTPYIIFHHPTVSPVEPLISHRTVLFRCSKESRGRWWPMLLLLICIPILSFRTGCLTRLLSRIVSHVRASRKSFRGLITLGGGGVTHGMIGMGNTTATRGHFRKTTSVRRESTVIVVTGKGRRRDWEGHRGLRCRLTMNVIVRFVTPCLDIGTTGMIGRLEMVLNCGQRLARPSLIVIVAGRWCVVGTGLIQGGGECRGRNSMVWRRQQGLPRGRWTVRELPTRHWISVTFRTVSLKEIRYFP